MLVGGFYAQQPLNYPKNCVTNKECPKCLNAFLIDTFLTFLDEARGLCFLDLFKQTVRLPHHYLSIIAVLSRKPSYNAEHTNFQAEKPQQQKATSDSTPISQEHESKDPLGIS